MAIANSRLRLADDVTFQSMGPGAETVMLSLGSGNLYTCNETTEAFLRALDGSRTFDQAIDKLAEQYEVAKDQLRGDLKKLTDRLLAEKLVVAEPVSWPCAASPEESL